MTSRRTSRRNLGSFVVGIADVRCWHKGRHGTRRRRRSPLAAQCIQNLEVRTLLSVSFNDATGLLSIQGTSSDDVAIVEFADDATVHVVLNAEESLWPVSDIQLISFAGGDGADTFENRTSIPTRADGGTGPDTLSGSTGPVSLTGGDGDDLLAGGQQDDSLSGGPGHDTLHGFAGHDHIAGDAGNDQLEGNAGNDTLIGGAGRDLVAGGDGDDVLGTSEREMRTVHVSTLDPVGPGSITEALSEGNRRIVFDVAGTIDLRSPSAAALNGVLRISNSTIEIDGASAPSPGITILGGRVLVLDAEDITIRHIRIRGGGIYNEDALSIVASRDVLVQNVSLAWSLDELADVWDGSVNVVFDQVLFAEPLNQNGHAQGLLVGKGSQQVVLTRSVFTHIVKRAPKFGFGTPADGSSSGLVVNNIIYNPQTRAMMAGNQAHVAAIGNLVIPGRNTLSSIGLMEVQSQVQTGTEVYLRDNHFVSADTVMRPNAGRATPLFTRGTSLSNPEAADWNVSYRRGVGSIRGRVIPGAPNPEVSAPPDAWMVERLSELEVLAADRVFDTVLATVGAYYWDRDAVDARAVADVRNRTGQIINTVNDVGGLPAVIPSVPGRSIPPGDDGDTLLGNDGNDVLIGDFGADMLDGGAGDDRLSGAEGDDTLAGGDGHDSLLGGAGDDLLSGMQGTDLLQGGVGRDSGVWQAGDGPDSFDGGISRDSFDITATDFDDFIELTSPGRNLEVSVNAESIVLTNAEAASIRGGAGVDHFRTDDLIGFGSDYPTVIPSGFELDLIGDDGNDIIDASAVRDPYLRLTLSGQEGDDRISLPGRLNAGLRAPVRGNAVFGGVDNDTITGGTAGELIDAGDGRNLITGHGGGDHLIARAGVDTIVGMTAADTLEAPINRLSGPGEVSEGDSFDLSADYPQDGTVIQVQFFHDTNGSGALEVNVDDVLHNDLDATNGWTGTFSSLRFPAGNQTFFARARLITGQWTEPVSIAILNTWGPIIGESGTVTFLQPDTETFQTVHLTRSYVNPVVIAGPLSFNGGDVTTLRVRNVTASSFEIQIDEWDYRDGFHTTETLSYLVVEAGTWTLSDGKVLHAGHATTDHNFTSIELSDAVLPSTPVVLTQTQTATDPAPVVTRLRHVTAAGFEVRLLESERSDGLHAVEQVGYVAISADTASDGVPSGVGIGWSSTVTHDFSLAPLPAPFETPPVLLAAIQTYNDTDPADIRYQAMTNSSVELRLQEEQSFDTETEHAPELVGLLALPAGFLCGREQEIQIAEEPVASESGLVIGESGKVTFLQPDTETFQTIRLSRSYENPVVVAGPLSFNGGDVTTLRVRNVTTSSFEIQIDEWDYRDAFHIAESVSYLVVEAGTWTLDDGTVLHAGHTTADHNFTSVDLTETGFDSTPVVIAQAQTAIDPSPVVSRLRNVTSRGFEVRVQESEASDGLHAAQQIGYVALSARVAGTAESVATVGWLPAVTNEFSPVSLATSFDAPSVLLAAMQTANELDPADIRYHGLTTGTVEMRLQEEQSSDLETSHLPEVVGFLALTPGSLSGTALASSPEPVPEPVSENAVPVIGESGRVTFLQPDADTYQRVELTGTYENPVVIAGPLSFNGGDVTTLRVRNVTGSSFEIQIDEWDYRDAFHIAETVSYLVMEAGTWTLADGTVLHAGHTTADHNFTSVNLSRAHLPSTPVVLAQSQTASEPEAVVTRIQNVTTTGFEVRLQESEVSDGVHAIEQIGYVTVSQSTSPGAATSLAIGWASSVNHEFSRVPIPALFDEPPLLLAAMQTFHGPDTADIRYQAMMSSSVELRLQEEQSLDEETAHTNEVIGLLTLQPGFIRGRERENVTLEAPVLQERVVEASGTIIGESGSLTFLQPDAEMFQHVELQHTYTNPVVIAGPLSFNGGDVTTLRIRNVTGTSFEIQIDEWDYRDAFHITETVSYLVVEAGTWLLDDRTELHAGHTTADHGFTSIDLTETGFDATPVVIAQAQTATDPSPVVSRLRNVTSRGFEIRVQESEASDGLHAAQQIGYVALSGRVAGTAESVATVGWLSAVTDEFSPISFTTGFDAPPVLLAAMQTANELDPADIRYRGLTAGTVELRLQEEQSRDTETAHIDEVVGLLTLPHGVLRGHRRTHPTHHD